MESGTSSDGRLTARGYFALVEQGLLDPDDRVELLDGIVVAQPPQTPLHASGIRWVDRALRRALGPEVLLSCQLPLVAGRSSVPEPDMLVLSGRAEDYRTSHPTRALLAVEVADSSLPQDRLTKSRIYAQAAVPDYWIVNLRQRVVEWYRDPDAEARVYRESGQASGADALPLAAFPGVVVRAGDLLPPD